MKAGQGASTFNAGLGNIFNGVQNAAMIDADNALNQPQTALVQRRTPDPSGQLGFSYNTGMIPTSRVNRTSPSYNVLQNYSSFIGPRQY